MGVGVFVEVGGGSAAGLRNPDCGLVDLCVECEFGARKRCGEGVCVGIVIAVLGNESASTGGVGLCRCSVRRREAQVARFQSMQGRRVTRVRDITGTAALCLWRLVAIRGV